MGLITGYLLSWPALVVLCLLAVVSEHNEAQGWAVFWSIVSAAVAIFYFQVPLDVVGLYFLAYAAIGVIWSIWRYKRYVSAEVQRIKERIAKNGTKEANVAYHLQPSNNIDKITSWIIIWPFSLVENLLRDIINLVEEVPKTVLRKVYNYIYEQEINKI